MNINTEALMRKIFTLATVVFLSSTASALTLEEALTNAYNHHEDLKVIRTDFLNEIEQFPQALSEFMPRISAGIDSTDTKVDRIGGRPGDPISRKNTQISKTITLDQPVFNGGRSVNAIKAAQSAFRASRGGYYDKEQKIILQEIEVYLSVSEAKEKYEISKASVKSNSTQLEAMKERFKLGESTDTEVASAQAALGAAEADQAVSYANYEAAKASFYQVFGIEPVDITMPVVFSELPKTLEELTEKAVALNPGIESARHSTFSSKANENAAKGALLPQVSLKVQHGRTSYNPQDDALLNNNNKSITSTLSVNVPILAKGGAEYSDIRRAKYQTRKSAILLDNQVKQIKSSCKANWEAYNASMRRIEATDQAVKAAEVAYNGMIQEEILGSKTIIDVLNAQDRLNKQRQSGVEARKEFALAGYRIRSLIGELTAKSMKLPVEYFSPEHEFKKVKLRIVGF
jgi:outer membrane protein